MKRPGRLKSSKWVGGAVLLLLPLVAVSGGPTAVTIVGATEVLPSSSPEYVVTWDGGVPPWTVRFDATDPSFDFSQEQFINKSSCDGTACESFPFFANYSAPQISELTATVIDAIGQTAHATPQRVRVASDGLLYIATRPTLNIRPDPEEPGRFFCFGEGNTPYMDVGNGDAFPFLDVYSDDTLVPPSSLTVSSQNLVDFSFALPYGIADRDWVETRPMPPPEAEIALNFPLRYGDYSDPDTLPWQDPLIPTPRIAELTRYSVRVDNPPVCNDPILTRTMEFYANPPQSGDVVLSGDACPAPFGRGENQDNCTLLNDVPIYSFFAAVRENDKVTLRRQAFASCVSNRLLSAILAVITYDPGQFIDDQFAEELILNMLTKPEVLSLARQKCADRLTGKKRPSPNGPSVPDFDLSIESGPLQIEISDPEFMFEVRTQFASITSSGPITYSVSHVPQSNTIIKAGDMPITVVPTNTALSPQVVPPMFEVTVNDTVISEPQLSNLIFRDNFD